MPATLYTADVVCPMSGPPLGGAGVLIEGDTILAVVDAESSRAEVGRHHHVPGVLLPGLINGHTHLELADAALLAGQGPYPTWLRAVDGMVAGWSVQTWQRSAHRGVLRVLRSGTTTVFDTVTTGPGVPAAARAGLCGDSFVEVVEVGDSHLDGVLGQLEHALGLPADGRRVGVAPASPLRLGAQALQALGDLARRRGAPVQTHVTAEDDAVAHLDAAGLLSSRTSLVHLSDVGAGAAQLLARHGVAVVCCPRSNERLRMGVMPLEHLAQAGVALALGTESGAAVADQDVLAEAGAWVRAARIRGLTAWPCTGGVVPLAEAAVRLATVEGARALGWGDRCGVLEPGRRADLVGVELDTSVASVYEDLVDAGPGRQVLTVLAGVRKARRESADVPWPAITDDQWRTS